MDIMNKVDTDTFIFFLRWLDEEKGWNASVIIDVVEKPNKYNREFNIYLEEKKWKTQPLKIYIKQLMLFINV